MCTAGVVLKYVVDGTAEPVSSGQTTEQAAYEANMQLCQYLASKKLSIDVWDGESLLQVGTASLDLPQLLRQGREFAELLIEVPILDQSMAAPDQHEVRGVWVVGCCRRVLLQTGGCAWQSEYLLQCCALVMSALIWQSCFLFYSSSSSNNIGDAP